MRWLGLLILCFAPGILWAGHPIPYRPVVTYPVSVIQKFYVAETVLVPVVVPSVLLMNLSSALLPPPVTIAPQALLEAQGTNGAMLQRMEALERKLDLLLQQPMTQAAPAASARPTIQQVAGTLKMHCAQCHSGANSRAEVQLFNDQGAYQPNVPPAVILAAVRGDRMPKGPNKLPREQKDLIEVWVKGGQGP